MNYITNCAICTSYLEILHVRKLESLQPSCVCMFCSVLIWWMWQYSPILLLTIWYFILSTAIPSCWTTELSSLIDYTFATFCVMTIVWLMLQTRLLYQGYWKNRPSQQLLKVFIYIYFAATCIGHRWPSSGEIHNYFRKVTSLQWIRFFVL
jgi:hypothetical protein